MATAKKATETVAIQPIVWKEVAIRIVGDTPLIMHCWSEKAKRQMLEVQMKTTKTKAREIRRPFEDFVNSMYWLSDKPEADNDEELQDIYNALIESGTARFGFPVTAIKQAGNSAAYRMSWVPNQMGLRGAYFIEGDADQMIEIKSDVPIMREDMVTVGISGTDLRYRGEFRNWYADLIVKFNTNGAYTLEQIINIINAGGAVCGIGEWRPEKDGAYGMYHVDVQG